MKHLLRELAPVSDAAWGEIDTEAARALKNFLAGRRLVDFEGPLGWSTTCVATGRTEPLAEPVPGVRAQARRARPFIELRAEFTLARAELDAIDKGAPGPDIEPVVDAARRIASAEDSIIFNGNDATGIDGLAGDSAHEPIEIGTDYGQFPGLVARAVSTLRLSGVDGPYGVALGPRCYTGVIETTEHGGYPVLEHLKIITGGPVVWAPTVDGSLVVSLRGGDFSLHVGQDLSIGYSSHDAEAVTLYLEESVTFANDAPEAAIALRYP